MRVRVVKVLLAATGVGAGGLAGSATVVAQLPDPRLRRCPSVMPSP